MIEKKENVCGCLVIISEDGKTLEKTSAFNLVEKIHLNPTKIGEVTIQINELKKKGVSKVKWPKNDEETTISLEHFERYCKINARKGIELRNKTQNIFKAQT